MALLYLDFYSPADKCSGKRQAKFYDSAKQTIIANTGSG